MSEDNDTPLLVHCKGVLIASLSLLVGSCAGSEPTVEAHVGIAPPVLSQLPMDGKDFGIRPKSVQASLDKNGYGTEDDT